MWECHAKALWCCRQKEEKKKKNLINNILTPNKTEKRRFNPHFFSPSLSASGRITDHSRMTILLMAALSHPLMAASVPFNSLSLIPSLARTQLLSCFLWPNYNTVSTQAFPNEEPRKHLLPFLVFDLSLHDSYAHMWRPACCAADMTFQDVVCSALIRSPCRGLDECRTCWKGSMWGGRLQRAPLRPRATNERQTECTSSQYRAPWELHHRCLLPDGVSVGQRQAVCLGHWAGPHYHISVIFLRFHAAGSSHPYENQTSRT